MFDPDIANEICSRISQGESLQTICGSDGMPTKTTVMRWLADDRYVGFRDQYARAREEAADIFAEEIVDIADQAVGLDAAGVNAARLRIDARKWAASKLKPKKYGERLELAGEVRSPISDEQLDQRIAGLLAKHGGSDPSGEAGTAVSAGGEGPPAARE